MHPRRQLLLSDLTDLALSLVRELDAEATIDRVCAELTKRRPAAASSVFPYRDFLTALLDEGNPAVRLVRRQMHGRIALTKTGEAREKEYLRIDGVPAAYITRDLSRPANPRVIKMAASELVVLAIIASFDEMAWSGPISDEFVRRTGSKMSEPTLASLLTRLKNSGLIEATLSQSLRGGKARSRFEVTKCGSATLEDLAILTSLD
jgi:hypothetical protein